MNDTKNLSEPSVDLEAQFLTAVRLITDQFGCKIIEIDFNKHVIDIDCPDDVETDCAMKLAEVFDKYLV